MKGKIKFLFPSHHWLLFIDLKYPQRVELNIYYYLNYLSLVIIYFFIDAVIR